MLDHTAGPVFPGCLLLSKYSFKKAAGIPDAFGLDMPDYSVMQEYDGEDSTDARQCPY
jgi:hypothetical protein